LNQTLVWGLVLVIGLVVVAVGFIFYNPFNNMVTVNSNGTAINQSTNNTNLNQTNNTSNTLTLPAILFPLIHYSKTYHDQGTSTSSNSESGSSPLSMDQIISLLDAYIKSVFPQTGIPGAAVLIVQNDEILYMNCLGVRDLASGAPVTTNTLFEIGSCSKAFSALNVYQLVEKGIMSWDDKVSKYFNSTEFQFYDSTITDSITLKDAILMRTGLPSQGGSAFFSVFNDSFADTLYQFRYLANDTAFRSKFQYNNVFYCIPSYAAARACNTTWDDLIKEYLLDPLGMTTATTNYTDLLNSPDHATSYIVTYNGTLIEYHWPNIDGVGPSGSIAVSISEMANWLEFQIAGTGEYNGIYICSVETLADTHTPQIEAKEGAYFGYGWGITDDCISFDGSTGSSQTKVAIIPSKNLGIALLSNEGPYGSAFNKAIYAKLQDLLNGIYDSDPWVTCKESTDATTLISPPDNPVPSLPLSTYVGLYFNSFYGYINVTANNSSLICYYGNNSEASELVHWNDSEFFDPKYSASITFTDISNDTANQLVSPFPDNNDTNQEKSYAVFNRTE